jgi:hypothetical protein
MAELAPQMLGFYAANESGPNVIQNSCTGGPRRSHCTAGACTGRRVEHACLSLQRREPGGNRGDSCAARASGRSARRSAHKHHCTRPPVQQARLRSPPAQLSRCGRRLTCVGRVFRRPSPGRRINSCLLVSNGSTLPLAWVYSRSQVGLTLVAQRVRMSGGNAVGASEFHRPPCRARRRTYRARCSERHRVRETLAFAGQSRHRNTPADRPLWTARRWHRCGEVQLS